VSHHLYIIDMANATTYGDDDVERANVGLLGREHLAGNGVTLLDRYGTRQMAVLLDCTNE